MMSLTFSTEICISGITKRCLNGWVNGSYNFRTKLPAYEVHGSNSATTGYHQKSHDRLVVSIHYRFGNRLNIAHFYYILAQL